MACKTCNSTLKKNFFLGSPSVARKTMRCQATEIRPKWPAEKAAAPLSDRRIRGRQTRSSSSNLQVGLLAGPKMRCERFPSSSCTGHDRDLFGLDDSNRTETALQVGRATLVRLLEFLELEGRATARTASQRKRHQEIREIERGLTCCLPRHRLRQLPAFVQLRPCTMPRPGPGRRKRSLRDMPPRLSIRSPTNRLEFACS